MSIESQDDASKNRKWLVRVAHVSDCFDRQSYPTQDAAKEFTRWMAQKNGVQGLTPFLCRTCQRWHIASCADLARAARAKSQEPMRATSDRELHLQMARNLGKTLDELQVTHDLSKVKLQGVGIETIGPRTKACGSEG